MKVGSVEPGPVRMIREIPLWKSVLTQGKKIANIVTEKGNLPKGKSLSRSCAGAAFRLALWMFSGCFSDFQIPFP